MTDTSVTLLAQHRAFGGSQRSYSHASRSIGLPMRFSVYLPPGAEHGTPGAVRLPMLLFLAGLTCTDDTFMTKAGALRHAAEHGMVLLAPDTSPRGTAVPGQADAWDFGTGAGFYLDASEPAWATHWRMESYLMADLLPLAAALFPIDPMRTGICGHSMGGHGALTLALRHPGRFRSVSALAPICAPMHCPWGTKAFTGYLGDDREQWAAHDASALMAGQTQPPYPAGILVDQGLDDTYLHEGQLLPERLEAACASARQPLALRRQAGYDHGYYFVQTFIGDHVAHHARLLGPAGMSAAAA